MAPTRPLKRQKTNDNNVIEAAKESEPVKPSQVPLPPETPPATEPSVTPAPALPPSPSKDKAPDSASTPSDSKQPWYRTWPRKAPPITQVVREGASIASDAASEVASVMSRGNTADRRASARNPSLAMTLGRSSASRSIPLNATTSNVHARPETTSPSRENSSQTDVLMANGKEEKRKQKVNEVAVGGCAASNTVSESDTQTDPGKDKTKDVGTKTPQTVLQHPDLNRSSWFGWAGAKDENATTQSKPKTEAQTPLPSASSMEDTSKKSAEPTTEQEDQAQRDQPSQSATNNKRTWLQMFSAENALSATAPKASSEDAVRTDIAPNPDLLKVQRPETPNKSSGASRASSIETSSPPPLPGDANKTSGWVFWSRERAANQSTSQLPEQPHVGELAISDTPSQTRPKRASISVPKDPNSKPEPKLSKQTDSSQKPLPATVDAVKQVDKARPRTPTSDIKTHAKKDSKIIEKESPKATARVKEPTDASSARAASPTPSKRYAEALLLPPFTETLRMQENPSILQQLTRLLYFTQEPELKHLSIVKDPPRIRNALAIGVHGYFPGPMVRTLLGQPTGTSIKFADMAAKSIRKWTNARGYDCKVKTAALEGEGKISERVDLLWKLLLNWIDEIRKSDFVLVACHSQGVPVAIMLVAKLIQFGCITAARVGICAMAGVSMGPFAEYKSRWISGSAGELFEFSDPNSKVSNDYLSALELTLKAGVRLTYIGSIDDQLVSLESSIFAPVTHPHIYRAVSIDPRIHAPSFLSHLVGFALKLRNLGVQDHGLIRELSPPLAGSLYSSEGHSRIYEDEAVYDLAVSFALETTSLPSVPVKTRNMAASATNPYILPFAMRGVLEEDFVKTDLQHEAEQLLKEFDDWKPSTKVLKDVKFRLEGVRSKL